MARRSNEPGRLVALVGFNDTLKNHVESLRKTMEHMFTMFTALKKIGGMALDDLDALAKSAIVGHNHPRFLDDPDAE